MLVLTRTVGQTLKLGDDIEVTLVAINGNQAKIGITAPRDLSVMRTELGDYNPDKRTDPRGRA